MGKRIDRTIVGSMYNISGTRWYTHESKKDSSVLHREMIKRGIRAFQGNAHEPRSSRYLAVDVNHKKKAAQVSRLEKVVDARSEKLGDKWGEVPIKTWRALWNMSDVEFKKLLKTDMPGTTKKIVKKVAKKPKKAVKKVAKKKTGRIKVEAHPRKGYTVEATTVKAHTRKRR